MAGEYTEADIDAFLAGGEPTGEPTTSGEYTEADIDAFLAGGEPTGSEEYNEADIDAFLGVEPDQNESDLPPFVDPAQQTEPFKPATPTEIFSGAMDAVKSGGKYMGQWGKDFARGAQNTATMGYAPQVNAAMQAVGAMVPGGEAPGDVYDEVSAEQTALDEEAAARNPGAFYGPDILSTAAAVPAIVKGVGKGAKYLAKASRNQSAKQKQQVVQEAAGNVAARVESGRKPASNVVQDIEEEVAKITKKDVTKKTLFGAGASVGKEVYKGLRKGQTVSVSSLFKMVNDRVDPVTAGMAGLGFKMGGWPGAGIGWGLGTATNRLMLPKEVARWRSAENNIWRGEKLMKLNKLTQKARSLYTPEGTALGLMGGANLLFDGER